MAKHKKTWAEVVASWKDKKKGGGKKAPAKKAKRGKRGKFIKGSASEKLAAKGKDKKKASDSDHWSLHKK